MTGRCRSPTVLFDMHRRMDPPPQSTPNSNDIAELAPPQSITQRRVEVVKPGRWLQMLTPDGFEHRRVHLAIEALPEALAGLRILHLSDLHMRDRWYAGYDQMLARIAADPPDIILFTGDFLESRLLRPRAIDNVRRFTSALRSRLGTYAILGNHDGDLLAPLLTAPHTAAGEWNLELID